MLANKVLFYYVHVQPFYYSKTQKTKIRPEHNAQCSNEMLQSFFKKKKKKKRKIRFEEIYN